MTRGGTLSVTSKHCVESLFTDVLFFFFSSLALPETFQKRRRKGLLTLRSPERYEDAEDDDNKDEDNKDNDDEDDFQPSEGSENEMETEMLDYI